MAKKKKQTVRVGYRKAGQMFPLSAEVDDTKNKKYDFSYCDLTSAWGPHDGNNGGFVLSWGVKGFGFGQLTFCIKGGKVDSLGTYSGGKTQCDSETLSKDFVKQALDKFIDGVKFVN